MTSCRCIKLETIPVGHTFWPVENCLYVVKLNLKSSNDDPLCRRCFASPSNRDAFAHELVATLSNQKMLANVTNFATVSVACPSRWSSSSKLHLFRPIPISFWHWGRVNLHFFKMKSKKKRHVNLIMSEILQFVSRLLFTIFRFIILSWTSDNEARCPEPTFQRASGAAAIRPTWMWLRNDPKSRSIGSKTWMTAPSWNQRFVI